MNYVKIGQFIKEKRLNNGFTQQQLADELFVDVTTVSKWERGVTFPDSSIITHLCSFLKINEHELFQACEDEDYRNSKKRLFKIDKGRTIAFSIISGCYLLAILTCFICNLAINHTLSWFFIVLTSCLCGWTFFPTCLRFFKNNKLLIFVGSTLLSLCIMFLTISLFTNNYWCFVAMIGTILGYFMFFFPFIFFKGQVFSKIHKFFLLIYSVGSYALISVLLILINQYAPINIGMGFAISSYCFTPIIICGIIRLIPKLNKDIKASLMILVSGLFVVGLNGLLNSLLDSSSSNYYKIDFANWNEYSEGNVTFIFSVIAGVGFIVTLVVGLIKTFKNTNSKVY